MAPFCDAVVVIVCNLCEEHESEDVWIQNAQELLDLTPGVPLGLYECPVPYWRILSSTALGWAASTGRFLFHKDTCCSTTGIKSKLEQVSTFQSFKFFNANVETLLYSLREGAHGFCGISANFYPWLHSFLCSEPRDSLRAEKVQRFLNLFEAVVVGVYPRSSKVFLGLWDKFGIAPDCRKPGMRAHTEVEMIKLRDMHAIMYELCDEIGVTPLDPASFMED
eukprot:TRINITY_DN14120_c0_g1_i2.p1 TRINITY_DN14120_c0_g1~~TRINITY_DN14120_c0_g1_i2.p1  ORF type:complete len:222 (+),score=47.28 TRINITY_DN14120_c0_g1_i2:149-814(+)